MKRGCRSPPGTSQAIPVIRPRWSSPTCTDRYRSHPWSASANGGRSPTDRSRHWHERGPRVTRIVAGSRGGRRLQTPRGPDTRPTSDRVREALFSTLESMTAIDGGRFADLYAGSGAVGLEAASRGAAAVLLVESDAQAVRVIRANIAALDLAGVCRVRQANVAAVVT